MEFRFGVILRHSGFRQMGGVFSQFQPHMIVLSGSKALYVTTFSRVQMNIYKKSVFSENLQKITCLAGFYCQITFSFSTIKIRNKRYNGIECNLILEQFVCYSSFFQLVEEDSED